MIYLLATTIIWAFSFSLIGVYLVGLDAYFSVFIRALLATIVFIPFTKFGDISHKLKLQLIAIGAIQIGIMYLFLYQSYNYLSIPEILLFTIFTPIYVTLIYDILHKKFTYLYLISASIAVLGAFIIRYDNVEGKFLFGFLLIQCANISFALGQSSYKSLLEKHANINQKDIFGYFFFGALFVTTIALFLFGNFSKMQPTITQWAVLSWLGIVASAIGYFLWNKGATIVDAGVLGIMNNALIPLALFVNILFWGKIENYVTLSIGSLVILFSFFVHQKFIKKKH